MKQEKARWKISIVHALNPGKSSLLGMVYYAVNAHWYFSSWDWLGIAAKKIKQLPLHSLHFHIWCVLVGLGKEGGGRLGEVLSEIM